MLCDICQRAATSWCGVCAAYFCDSHGGDSCFRCNAPCKIIDPAEPPFDTAVYAIDKDSVPAGKGFLQCDTKPPIPTIHIDDEEPPECNECGRFAKKICSNCQALCCTEHAGRGNLCRNCLKSSRLGLIVLVVVGVVLGAAISLNWFVSQWESLFEEWNDAQRQEKQVKP